jgi:hypothetical protein
LIALIVVHHVHHTFRLEVRGLETGNPSEIIQSIDLDLVKYTAKRSEPDKPTIMLDYYNILLLSRHPIFQPFRKIFQLSRPTFQIWTDASGQGYGAHLGPAKRPIALFQHKRLPSINLLPPNAFHSIKLPPANIQMHEAAALYLCIHHWRTLLRGSNIDAYMDNSGVCEVYGGQAKGTKEVRVMTDAIKELVKAEDIELKVTWIRRDKNVVADGLSKFAQADDPRYTRGAQMLMEMGKKEKKVVKLVKKIIAADSITPSV